MRLDSLMFEQGLTPSREKARSLIMAGKVSVDGKPAQKPGMEIKDTARIAIAEDPVPFVSRGGLKLEKAVNTFELHLEGRIAADIGASTGGFTDCMLQHGAAKVYALDVGYGQLDWKLRNDPRVIVMERTNARNMLPDWYDPLPSFASIDVSFISLRLILEPLYACLAEEAEVIALIKPQFEAGRAEVGKHGVVRDIAVHQEVCRRVITQALEFRFALCGLSFSPVTGPKGNIEFLSYFKKSKENSASLPQDFTDLIQETVQQAHTLLLHPV